MFDDVRVTARIGSVAAGALRELGGTFGARLEGPALVQHLQAHGYEPHPAVLAFDAVWGGLTFDEHTIGAAACVASGERGGAPGAREGLVPVGLSDNDNYYFLARDGTAWGQDGIEDSEAVLGCVDGDRLIARLVLFCVAWERRLASLAVDLDGARGATIADALAIPLLPEATDAYVTTWGDPRALVFERAVSPRGPVTTLVAVADVALLARVPRGQR